MQIRCSKSSCMEKENRLYSISLGVASFAGLVWSVSQLLYLLQRAGHFKFFSPSFFVGLELGRSPEGDISITDGYYNLTFFKRRPALGEMRMDLGLHHIGLEVDNLEEVKGRFLTLNPRGMILQESDDIHHGEVRIHDPECHPVSLSTKGF